VVIKCAADVGMQLDMTALVRPVVLISYYDRRVNERTVFSQFAVFTVVVVVVLVVSQTVIFSMLVVAST